MEGWGSCMWHFISLLDTKGDEGMGAFTLCILVAIPPEMKYHVQQLILYGLISFCPSSQSET